MEIVDANLPGVKHINALFDERLLLHDEMLNIPAFKAALYSASLSGTDDDFWSTSPESRHHAIIDMMLNVRTATNRTRLLENRRHLKDNLRLLEQSCDVAQRRKNRAKAIAKHRAQSAAAEGKADEDDDDDSPHADVLRGEDDLAKMENEDGYWVVGGKEIKESRRG